jgi:peptidoglycan/LPS O-acetylase OafA/YrhL
MLIIASVSIEQSKSINIPYILIYLGDASYSIYLTHGFFMSNVSKVVQKYIEKFNFISLGNNIFIDYIIVLIILGVTIGCGCIIHSYVEKPLNIFFRKKLLPKST